MFRQSGNSAAGPSASGELLVTGGGSGPGSDVNLTDVGGSPIALGQAAMADSLPVVIASDQTPLPISITSADVNLIEVGGAAIALGQAAMASSLPVVIASDQSPIDVTFTPSGTQDVNLIEVAGAAVATGHGTAAGAIRVELPTDGTGVLATVGTVTTVTSATVIQGTATNLKTQAEAYQAGSAVGAANPLQVSLANTGANATPVAVSLASAPTTSVTQGTSPWVVAGNGTAGTAASGVLSVQGIASMTPVQVSQATASNLNAQVVGDVASDTADAGNPVKIGGKAIDYAATPTAVTANDRVNATFDRAGVQFVLGGHMDVTTLEAEYTAAQTNTAIVTVSSGTRIVVTQIAAVLDAATSVDVGFRIGFGATTTPTTTGVLLTHPGIKATTGSGFSRGSGSGILGIGADGEDVRITSEVPTDGALRILVTYFTIAT